MFSYYQTGPFAVDWEVQKWAEESHGRNKKCRGMMIVQY